MPAVKIYSDGWVATILTGPASNDGFYQVYCTTLGETNALALAAAAHVLNVFAFGRLAMIRANLEAVSETDFDTKKMSHKGFVRFIYKLEAGEWHYPEAAEPILGFSAV